MTTFNVFENVIPPSAIGIYFLADDDMILYAGSSPDAPYRVVQHTRNKEFVRAFYLTFTSLSEARRIEVDFIRYLKPPLNKQRMVQRDPTPTAVVELEALIERIPDNWRPLFKPRRSHQGGVARRKRVINRGKTRIKLTAITIDQLRPNTIEEETENGIVTGFGSREVSDEQCPGLRLRITKTGHKVFIMRFRNPANMGQIVKLTLGDCNPFGDEANGEPMLGAPLTLHAARVLTMKVKQHLKMKRDPREYMPRVEKRNGREGDRIDRGEASKPLGPRIRLPTDGNLVPAEALPETPFLLMRQDVQARYGVRRYDLDVWIDELGFPKPQKLPRRPDSEFFRRDDVAAWEVQFQPAA